VNAPTTDPIDYDVHQLGGHAVVPYISSWTGEKRQTDRDLVYRSWREGIAYADEVPADRDEYGVLWLSTSGDLGTGRPLYKEQHAQRQRRAMADLLCQVCAGPADQTEQGTLWLLPAESKMPRRGPTRHPPICLACARVSVRACPALRAGFVLVSARSRVYGVSGLLYAPGGVKPEISIWDVPELIIAHGSRLAPWVLALQLHRMLYGISPLHWDEVT
jgi:hypothetical protein